LYRLATWLREPASRGIYTHTIYYLLSLLRSYYVCVYIPTSLSFGHISDMQPPSWPSGKASHCSSYHGYAKILHSNRRLGFLFLLLFNPSDNTDGDSKKPRFIGRFVAMLCAGYKVPRLIRQEGFVLICYVLIYMLTVGCTRYRGKQCAVS
jgi:hypothetical protein